MTKLIRINKIQPLPKKLIRVLGRWCATIQGRLPYPVECQFYQEKLFWTKYPKCKGCNRQIQFQDWKDGKYADIIREISTGKNYYGKPVKPQ